MYHSFCNQIGGSQIVNLNTPQVHPILSRCFYATTQWFTVLERDGAVSVLKWTSRVNLDQDYDYMMIPINISQSHWYLEIPMPPWGAHARGGLLALASLDSCHTLGNSSTKSKPATLAPYHSLHVRVTI